MMLWAIPQRPDPVRRATSLEVTRTEARSAPLAAIGPPEAPAAIGSLPGLGSPVSPNPKKLNPRDTRFCTGLP
jgi:hypothetical protein